MLYELCLELNNFFEYAKYIGDITIENGNVQTELLADGQYFRIVGSTFNDGVYQYPQANLIDEAYHGGLWAMAVPPAVIALSDEIDQWKAKYQGIDSTALSPYQSESFGGYSYTKANGNGASGNASAGWQDVFAGRLNVWRKLK